MSSTFTGFSEEDLKRIKSSETDSNIRNDLNAETPNARKIDRLGARPKKIPNQYKPSILQKHDSLEAMDNIFDKCKLSIKTPTSPTALDNIMKCYNENNTNENDTNTKDQNETLKENITSSELEITTKSSEDAASVSTLEMRRNSSDIAPDIIRCADNYTEDDLATHRVKLQELQLRQRLMEEQNKKRKEMLSKALADRTKQTEEEVLRLEKIKKELQVLDGQFTQDVAVLRKKIDQACLSYADAEKHYLRIEKEFLQAKISLQKEKEKKELLTEHLCALITHNETRKAQKLETLMLELATDAKNEVNKTDIQLEDEEIPVIIDGVDENTGKIVEFTKS